MQADIKTNNSVEDAETECSIVERVQDLEERVVQNSLEAICKEIDSAP